MKIKKIKFHKTKTGIYLEWELMCDFSARILWEEEKVWLYSDWIKYFYDLGVTYLEREMISDFSDWVPQEEEKGEGLAVQPLHQIFLPLGVTYLERELICDFSDGIPREEEKVWLYNDWIKYFYHLGLQTLSRN